MITLKSSDNNYLNHLVDDKKITRNILNLVNNYIEEKNNTFKIDINYGHNFFLREILKHEDNTLRHNVSQKFKITDDFYLFFGRNNIVYGNKDKSLDFPIFNIDEKFANTITDENNEVKSLAEINTSNYFSYYPEEYQPLAKFIYDINNTYLKKSENIYSEIKSKKNQMRFNSVKLTYLDYLQGNYYVVIDTHGNLAIEPRFNIADDVKEVVSKLALSITNFKTYLFTETTTNLNYLIDKIPAFLIELYTIIDDFYYSNNNTIKPIEKWNAIIKKINRNLKTCHQSSPNKLKPKFDNHDYFYLLFPANIHKESKSFDLAIDIKNVELHELIKNDKQLNFINEDAKERGYDSIINDWRFLYLYEPEMYQKLTKWCYDILKKNNNNNSNVLYCYESIISQNWRVAKISYEDYIKGNYKLIVRYKYPFPSSEFKRREYEIISTKEDLLLNSKSKQEIINPIKENLTKAMSHVEKFLLKPVYESLEDDNNYKINILKPLFIPINTENNLLTIEDFCFSVDLLIGNIYHNSRANFYLNMKYQHKKTKS